MTGIHTKTKDLMKDLEGLIRQCKKETDNLPAGHVQEGSALALLVATDTVVASLERLLFYSSQLTKSLPASVVAMLEDK